MQYIKSSLILFISAAVIVCGIYPILLWGVGQIFFADKTTGGILFKDDKAIGARLIAQSFLDDKHFHSRPSAANYDASFSKSSSLAASNYKLRERIAKILSQVARDTNGQLMSSSIDSWFKRNRYNNKEGIVKIWANLYSETAKDWAASNIDNQKYISKWAADNPNIVEEFTNEHTRILVPTIAELTIPFFRDFSDKYPGKFPKIIRNTSADGKETLQMQLMDKGKIIQEIFFAMWLQDNPAIILQEVPADFVTTSASGLDPHITLENATLQLSRVSKAWAIELNRAEDEINREIRKVLDKKSFKHILSIGGEQIINVLELNLALHTLYDHDKVSR